MDNISQNRRPIAKSQALWNKPTARACLKGLALLLGLVAFVGNAVASEESVKATKIEFQSSTEIPYESQILQYGLKNLNLLKQAQPDLHSAVMSADWESINGLEQLRVVASHTFDGLGMKPDYVDDYLSRIENYESNVPQPQKSQLDGVYAKVAETLLREIMFIEQDKEGVSIFVDVYSIILEDSPPERLESFKECLNKTHDDLISNLYPIVDKWVDSMEEIPINEDILVPHVKLRADLILESSNNRLASHRQRMKCIQDAE